MSDTRRFRVAWRAVQCPACRRHFRALVNPAWARREIRRRLGYPLLTCVACAGAERTGAPRNPEREAL